MISMPGMPSVKHTAELWFDEPKCETRRVDLENKFYYFSLLLEFIIFPHYLPKNLFIFYFQKIISYTFTIS